LRPAAPAFADEIVRFEEVAMLIAARTRRLMASATVVVVAGVIVRVMVRPGVRVDLVMQAAGIPSNASGLGGFVNGAHALVTPALVMVAAIAPLALIAGGIVLLFGGRSSR
jgi:hypothetical protein